MTALALAGKCGFFGASGSLRPAAAPSLDNSAASAMEPTPTAQSWKKCRRVRASVNALSMLEESIATRLPVRQKTPVADAPGSPDSIKSRLRFHRYEDLFHLLHDAEQAQSRHLEVGVGREVLEVLIEI